MPTTGERFERAVQIMARLRAPGGCPWDREQTFDSIKPYTLEETYEVLEAIDDRDWPELTGELGDLLLQVLFYSEMAREAGYFSLDDVLERLSNKLVDRHPHVFGDVKADTSAEVLRNWEALKAQEKEKKRLETGGEEKRPTHERSVLAGVSARVPALMEAHKLSSRAARVGFDWPAIEGLFDKLAEETAELREALKGTPIGCLRELGLPDRGSHRFRPKRASDWRTRSAICFLCLSTLRATFRSIPSRRCAGPIASSSDAFNGWKNGCMRADAGLSRRRWKNSKNCGKNPSDRKSRRDRKQACPYDPEQNYSRRSKSGDERPQIEASQM
jgi:MazG family protein